MYIYKTTNLINNKIYIGQSSYPVEESTNYLGSGSILNRAIAKYGKDQFTKEILERDITNINDLNLREIYYIAKYNSTNDTIGYNITSGGTGGDTISNHPDRDTIVAKISKSIKELWEDPEHRSNMSAIRLKTWSDPEYKDMMVEKMMGHPAYPNQQRAASETWKGRKHKPESIEKCRQWHLGKKYSKEINMKKGRPGSKWYNNPNTGETRFTTEVLSTPWIRGRGKLK
jgi:group I intron endonuclease